MPITQIDIGINNISYRQDTLEISQIDVRRRMIYVRPTIISESKQAVVQGFVKISASSNPSVRVFSQ